ncbi:MAG: hypothetical protein J6I50_02665 [Clostridia bacterium]|nr:hypothetical protein [Clostridia bacterium]
MAQWASGYLEQALSIPKIWGDIFGTAMFSVMLGMGRTLYAKKGNHIERVLLLGAIGALLCYLTAAVCPFPSSVCLPVLLQDSVYPCFGRVL